MNALIERDRGLLWHPSSAALDAPPPYAVLAALARHLQLEAADHTRFDAITGAAEGVRGR